MTPRRRDWLRLGRRVRHVAEEVDEEIRFHLETRAAELERLGATPEEARARALEEFGDPRAAREELEAIDRPMARSRDRLQWLAELYADLRHAGRRLARDRSYALISVATLALGLAVNLTIASLVHSTLLRPLPYRDADRLFHLWETKAG
ncbi:MAG: permease prefix domain 1-containing protein, partial [Gemmatimonadales bacterium]